MGSNRFTGNHKLEGGPDRRSGKAGGAISPGNMDINLMSANLEEPLSQDQLAHYVGRSKRQIERLFQSQLGTTPVRYYLELRITESRRLLQHSDLSLIDVALACGFVSPSHFSKCYASFYGYGPSKEARYGCVKRAEKPVNPLLSR